MRFIILALMVFITACSGTGNRYSATSDFYYQQVHENGRLEDAVFTPLFVLRLKSTPYSLRPTEDDFLTAEADLNNDGRMDIIGTINHFKFEQNGTYPLYIFIADEYGHREMENNPRISSFELKVLDTASNGYRDFSAGERIFRYNGTNYE